MCLYIRVVDFRCSQAAVGVAIRSLRETGSNKGRSRSVPSPCGISTGRVPSFDSTQEFLNVKNKRPKVIKELFRKYFSDLSDSLLRSHEDLQTVPTLPPHDKLGFGLGLLAYF